LAILCQQLLAELIDTLEVIPSLHESILFSFPLIKQLLDAIKAPLMCFCFEAGI
jgi:hypothetical protein